MQPDVVAALDRLESENVLSAPEAAPLRRVAAGALLSIRVELRVLLYGGVALIAAGAGVFVRDHFQQLAPAAITLALSVGCAACLAYVLRRAPEFSWGRVASPTLGFDYILLLAVLLFGSDLAYVEARFTLLGPYRAYDLLFYSLVGLAAAIRFDSAAVLSVALTSFAAWRGVAAKNPLVFLFSDPTARIRANAIACGALFVAGAVASVRWGKKAHFEPVWAHLGLLLLFGSLLSGALATPAWETWEIPVLALSAAAVAAGLRLGRELYLAEGVIAGYLGLLKLVLHPLRDDTTVLAVVTVSGIGVLVLLLSLHRLVRSRPAA